MTEFNTQIESIKESATDLFKLYRKQLKFEIVETVAEERANLFFSSILMFALLLCSILGSIFLALVINEFNDSSYLGYGLVASFWGLLILFGILFKKMIKNYLFDQFANKHTPS